MESNKHGSPTFYNLLDQMSEMHNKKSHDYASNSDPYGNYHFAGKLGQLFKNPDDAGFIARVGEKLYRLSNLENEDKTIHNESIEDTELDIVTIIALWVASRRDRRERGAVVSTFKDLMGDAIKSYDKLQTVDVPHKCLKCPRTFIDMHIYAKHAEDMHAAIYNNNTGTLKFNDSLEFIPNLKFNKS